MPRIRYIKPDFFKDDDLAQLPYETRLFYAGLWGLADKEGRLEDRPLRLKAEIFPYDSVDVEECLRLLASRKKGSNRPFINRYTTDNERYIQIISWAKHQKPHHTERESQIPAQRVKGMEKKKEKERMDEASAKLRNGNITVKERLLNDFEEARKLYPGTKRGRDTEFKDFCKKHKDWELVLPTMKNAIEAQIKWRAHASGDFRPAWKNFSTWINQRCWEDEPNGVAKRETTAERLARIEKEGRV